ncbi:hypothetical protein QAD02_018991 [Eretmocerus hayati]|uniref:Uncharacterized protein n=1 Tax=Eretmocerus hayati TaxID=131215 RepID=A0ACC2PHX8_9HYME|nr:hypothetical protein QAD02_018991 [Eretmocerus hayati]
MEFRGELQTIFEHDPDQDEQEEEERSSSEIWLDQDEIEKTVRYTLPYDTKYEASEDETESFSHWSQDTPTILSSSSSSNASIKSYESTSEEGSLTHPCLRHISISDSEMKFANLYTFFSIPEDPGLDAAFWTLYPSPRVYKEDGAEKFYDICKVLGAAPIECLREQFESDKIDLQHYVIDQEHVQALSKALLFNTTVQRIDLEDSYLSPNACYHLNQLLLRNTVLKSLNLTACKIGAEGAMKLEEGIAMSSALTDLNLSRCELGNEGLFHVARAASENTLLKSLNLSSNNLDEHSAPDIQKLLKTTESLEYLNLSWNSLNGREASEILFGGLTQNTTLTEVDLSWNAMDKESISFISSFISKMKRVKKLNLEANRFTDTEISRIARALLSNKTLEELHLKGNPCGFKGITSFIKILASPKFNDCPLKLLNLSGYWPMKEIKPVIDQLKETKPELFIKLGGFLSDYEIVGPDLRELFFKSANHEAMSSKKKKERKDFGQFVMSLGDSIISKDQFITTVLEPAKIKISEELANQIMNQFLVTKKTFDQSALKESYLSYFPDTKLPEIPQPKLEEVETPKEKSKKTKNQKSAKSSTKSKTKKKGKK